MSKSAQAAVAISQAVVDADEVVGGIEAEVPDDAALAALADEKLDGEALNRPEKSAGDTMLSRYFRDMATHRVLRPDEEVEAAKAVEDLERKYWVALLAYPPAFETIEVPATSCQK